MGHSLLSVHAKKLNTKKLSALSTTSKNKSLNLLLSKPVNIHSTSGRCQGSCGDIACSLIAFLGTDINMSPEARLAFTVFELSDIYCNCPLNLSFIRLLHVRNNDW